MKTAKWIRERRAAAGLSQAELAHKVGVTQPIVSQWERGIAKPSPLVLDKLRATLEKPAEPTPVPVVEAVRNRPAASAAPEPSPRRGRTKKAAKAASGANHGFEDKLWAAADKLRGHMDASEYKNVVLGLIF